MVARRKKRNRHNPRKAPPLRKETVFNSPFKGLVFREKEAAGIPEDPPPARKPDNERQFLAAMAGVEPISRSKKIVTGEPDPRMKPAHPARNDELEGLASL